MTGTSRRVLLRASAFAAVAAPFVSAESAAAARGKGPKGPKGPKRPRSLYGRSRFAPLLNAKFTLTGSTGSWLITLTQVSDIPQAAAGDAQSFGLTFRASTAGPPQGTYTLRRRGFTPTTLFVVPSDASRRTYQAIVNCTF